MMAKNAAPAPMTPSAIIANLDSELGPSASFDAAWRAPPNPVLPSSAECLEFVTPLPPFAPPALLTLAFEVMTDRPEPAA